MRVDGEHSRALAAELTEVDPFSEVAFRGESPLSLAPAREHCAHAACRAPTGIPAAIEVHAGLALPREATITVTSGRTHPP